MHEWKNDKLIYNIEYHNIPVSIALNGFLNIPSASSTTLSLQIEHHLGGKKSPLDIQSVKDFEYAN